MTRANQHEGQRDAAAPFIAFLAGGVVVVVAVLAFLTYQEGQPRRTEALAQNFSPRITPSPSATPDPQPLPISAPAQPR